MIKEIKNLLTENENVVLDARIHWIVFVMPAIYLTIAFFVGVFFHWLVGFLIVFVSIYPAYNAFIHYWMTHLVLTNKKVMYRNGFLSRDWVQLRYERIETAHLEEPILGRYLGYSTVNAGGVGTGQIRVPYVIRGDEFTKVLEAELEKNRNK